MLKRRLMIMLIPIALTIHGAVSVGWAVSSAPKPVGPLLADAQVICTAKGVIYSIDSEKLAGDHQNCKACLTLCLGSALVGPVLSATIPQGRLVLVSPVSFGALKVNCECDPARSRAPPLIL